ncbi:MAG: glycosyltransferase, partial [Candidatus Paceibacterota bacterium]
AIFRSNKGNFQIPSSRPVIYVTGGSLGAHALNKHIEQILDKLLEKYTIIHQTGAVRQYADYERLSKRASKYYIVQKHVSSAEIGYVYGRSSVVVSRAGANTVFELIALAKPAVLVPLPISAAGEQQAHARLLKDRGVAEIFSQERDSDVLFDLIEKVVDRRATYSKNFSNLANLYKKNAASLLVSEMLDSI